MKILWLDINSSYSHSSLAIPALDAQLEPFERELNEWHIISGSLKQGSDWFVENIVAYSPDVILSTLWLFNHNLTMEVLAKSHALSPHSRIVLGGPEFLGDNLEFLVKYPYVEAVFRGEAEEIFPSFIKKLGTPDECYNIKGFCRIDNSGAYSDTGNATVKSFTTLKPPEESTFFAWDKPFVQLETSRGCFNKCAFCISGNIRKIDELPVNVLKKRVEKFYQKGIREIRILDRTFNANTQRAVQLINLFSEFNGAIEFHTEIHPTFINNSIREAIDNAPSGSLHFEAGIQSFQEKVLKSCNRFDKKEDTIEGIRYLSELRNHKVHTDLIAGLPHYTYSQLLDDLHVLIKIYPDEIQLESLKLLPGTELREKAGLFGIKYSPLPPYEVLETPNISHHEMRLSHYLSIIIDIYYNKPEWKYLFTGIVHRNPSFLGRFTKFFYSNNIGKSINLENKGLILWNFCKEEYSAELDMIAVRWMENGLSFNIEPGALSSPWKLGDTITNPLLNKRTKDNKYRYIEFSDRRHWFLYNRKSNSSKSLLNLIEIF